ncbi:MAG: hypothetical protein EA360_04700 [Balneolaceae bacterium]|nr:MAG: hypothetical protein EA360_04700 [Balneolaceae bacterium]
MIKISSHFYRKLQSVKWLVLSSIFLISCTDPHSESIPDFTGSNNGPYIIDISHLEIVKDNSEDPVIQRELQVLLNGADRILSRDDFQFVTDKSSIPPSGNLHDYMSIARYLFPDSTGAYTVSRDGITNPEIYNYDRPRLADLSFSVYVLSLSYFFTENESYAEKASKLIQNWFFKETTRMNPNMNHAQVAKNVNTGSAQGIIDANDLIRIIESVSLLYDSPYWTSNMHVQLKRWFYRFGSWVTSNYNPDAFCDPSWCNNISTWLDAQKAIYFRFTEQDDKLDSNRYIEPVSRKIALQFDDRGKQKFENRVLSQHYYYFNLKGFMQIAMIRKNRDAVDRDWPVLDTENYGGIKPALDVIVSYLEGESAGDFFRTSGDFDNCQYLKVLKPAAVAFNSDTYDQAARDLLNSGCNDPVISLVYPSLAMIAEAEK